VAVVGPGDKLKVHDKADDLASGIDRGEGSKDKTTATSLQLLMPATIKQDLRFLVVTIHRVGARARRPLRA
jgi:hypothetical protein